MRHAGGSYRKSISALILPLWIVCATPVATQARADSRPAPNTESPTEIRDAARTDRPRNLRNSAQFGIEYDDNIYKTFEDEREKDDVLLRLLLNTNHKKQFKRTILDTTLQVGGKKHATQPAQDTLIGRLAFNWRAVPKKRYRLGIQTQVKGQFESGAIDRDAIDINEDFVGWLTKASATLPLPFELSASLFSRFHYFSFFGSVSTDFLEETVGLKLTRQLTPQLTWDAGFDVSLVQFLNVAGRHDQRSEVVTNLSFYGPLLLALGYTYEDNRSRLNFYASTAHKVNLLASFAFHTSDRYRSEGGDVTLNLLGTLQIRRFPAVSISNEEGQRLFLLDGENNNFNTVTLKVTKRLTHTLTLEAKVSRQDNAFSDRESAFSRNRFMLGVRAAF